ncbi:hypothetical protein EOW65_07745 [Sinirhodobacter ferrireducens]|uniref:Sulfotransferase family protein n=1 Tax=Paenirhodobacter ferrireducens TaxID=1215032 RepID=A0A443LL45_9RHOB|nr:hypothetical protein [Sinirhodobacter ferrireducens]RWR49839.1 hypothetical protein EOW65_07745 [Sinirhodobacter ferrireducens]
MHRSGTSALSELLIALGCDGPATPMPAADENPRGFFESFPLFKQHEALLASAGSSWNDYRPFPASWLSSPKADEFRERIRTTLETEYGDSGFFALKDPRICRFLPLWTELLDEMQIQPIVVHTHRNPLEVAASLHTRNAFAPEYGSLLWLRHVLDAEAGSRGLPRAFTSYDQLLNNWGSVAEKLGRELRISWPRFSPVNMPMLRDAIEPGLQHHSTPPEATLQDPLLSGWLRETYRIMQSWAETGENPKDHARLDEIRDAFDESAVLLGSLVTPTGDARAKELEKSRSRLAEIEPQLAERAKTIETLTAERNAARARAAEIEPQMAERAKAVDTLTAERNAASAERDRLTAELAERARRDEVLSSERKALQDELNRTQNILTQRKAEIDDAAAALHRTQDLLTRAELRIESQAQEISALRSARDRRDTELSEITKSLATARSDLTAAQAELARREAEMARLQTEHLALTSGLAESETTLAQRESDLARASGRLAEAEADVARLAAQHGVLERKVQIQADEISALSASNAERDTELSEVAKIILEYQQGLEDARARADRQRSSIETARTTLAETQGLLSQKFDLPAARVSAAAEDLSDLLAALRRQIEDLAGTYEQTKEQLSAVSAHNDALVHSTSWRLTSPMRWIVRHLRRS